MGFNSGFKGLKEHWAVVIPAHSEYKERHTKTRTDIRNTMKLDL